ncbi:Restriction endonuclease type II-like [Acididesulfobacillus acetoxydans]|uniref:Endonuclease, Uma2 (Restriction endonuclease fold) n=1 Tax=Acididesulfobacillus acetoxydans TaxID=1561005 RepID=A0A8S0WL14_9FIRM|nr:Uma2 family endonuclease [Acididesulfobacillus acetoxydans]CAA7599764.1 Restriction endonuclease type II-like [Acididesulfobacillus acetoxydans]CEJ07331.1 Endonuclease, Uma2 (Restriction endonuclease fold) [Acididesulfobacillus acetoxydans]
MPIREPKEKNTYADYLTWPEDERWEIIDGVPYMQSAPTWQHQSISGDLYRQISNYLVDKPCKVFAAPFDLCIPENDEKDEDISNIISQPDIVVVCDESKLRKTGYFGVPSLIIEISSPSTARKDKLIKFNKFEKAGVREYWIVEPENKLISVFTLQENNRYGRPEVYSEEDQIKVNLFPELTIDLKSVFPNI